MGDLYIVWGAKDTGKTATIRYIAEKLVVRYMGKKKNDVKDNIADLYVGIKTFWGAVHFKELLCIINLSTPSLTFPRTSIIIGICTAGDGPKSVYNNLTMLQNCDVVICGCRIPFFGRSNKPKPFSVFYSILHCFGSYKLNLFQTSKEKEIPVDCIDYKIARSILHDVCNLVDSKLGLISGGSNTFINP